MDYTTYYETAQDGAKLHENGDYAGAIAVFQGLVDSDISDLDRAMMCHNVAQSYRSAGQVEDALYWYDRGIEYESPYYRFFVAESKAAYLAERGYDAESLAIYEALYPQPYLTENDKERIWNNISILRNPRP
jgi:tetratricopeptide (TPR) repeat protein